MSKNKITVVDNSKAVKSAIYEVSKRAMLSACLLVESQAKALAKVGNTGELRDKISHNITETNDGLIGQVGSPLIYAIYKEFGTGEFAENGAGRKGGWVYPTADGKFYFTRGMKPQPFLRPAFRQNKANIQKIFANDLGKNFK